MFNKDQICSKINELYPGMGECGKDIHVSFDSLEKAWVVDLESQGRHRKTYVEIEDAALCVEKDQCLGLAFQISQLKN